MDSEIGTQIIILIILLLLSGFFSSAETSLVAVSKIRMRTLSEEGNARAKMVLDIYNNQAKMLSAILIGNNLVNTFAASITATIAYNFGGAAVSVATFLITLLILIFGEITPKTLAADHAEKMALTYAPIVKVLMFIPFVFVAIIYLLNPNYFDPLFSSTLGFFVIGVIIIMIAIYIWVLQKILKVKV